MRTFAGNENFGLVNTDQGEFQNAEEGRKREVSGTADPTIHVNSFRGISILNIFPSMHTKCSTLDTSL
jgi:hypothetical protein